MKNVVLQKYEQRAEQAGSLLCVGLDPEFDRIPKRFHRFKLPLFEFCKWIVEQTAEFASAYKPNTAFFEARGALGWRELEATAELLRTQYPEHLTICDAKRGDIAHTNRGYVTGIFDHLGFDAITLSPYLGKDALDPFLDRRDKMCIILCRTSNPGAGGFQDLHVDGCPLWQVVAEQVCRHWNHNHNCMLVTGATWPREMRSIRCIAPDLTFLVPGIGAQGGDVAQLVRAGLDSRGKGLIFSSSRSILFSDDPAEAARSARDEIEAARKAAKDD
jgi:orotidine-5'-phosphate decarboxylase